MISPFFIIFLFKQVTEKAHVCRKKAVVPDYSLSPSSRSEAGRGVNSSVLQIKIYHKIQFEILGRFVYSVTNDIHVFFPVKTNCYLSLAIR